MKSFKKLSLTLLTVTAIGQVQAETDLYQPRTPWPLAPVEDVVVGTVGVVTLDHVGSEDESAASGLLVAVPDAVPGVSYARGKNNHDSEKTTKGKRKRHEGKEKSTKSKSSKSKTIKKRKTDNDDTSY